MMPYYVSHAAHSEEIDGWKNVIGRSQNLVMQEGVRQVCHVVIQKKTIYSNIYKLYEAVINTTCASILTLNRQLFQRLMKKINKKI